MSNARKVFAVAALVALGWAVAPVAEAHSPIRIGASASQTRVNWATGQPVLRGYQLCVKHLNDKGGVLGRKLDLVVFDDGPDKVDLVLGPQGSPIRNLERGAVDSLRLREAILSREVVQQPDEMVNRIGPCVAAVRPGRVQLRRSRTEARGP